MVLQWLTLNEKYSGVANRQKQSLTYPLAITGHFMSRSIIILFLLASFNSYGQDSTVCEIVKEFDSPYHPPTIQLFKDNISLHSARTIDANELTYTKLGPGNYKLVFSSPGQDTKTIHSILVEERQILTLRIKMKGPCLYDYPKNYIPTCPENHTDKIIPIIYGLVVHVKSKANEKQEPDYFSGGCVTTGCDPKYYCTIHKIEF
jgi:hypothetical protein